MTGQGSAVATTAWAVEAPLTAYAVEDMEEVSAAFYLSSPYMWTRRLLQQHVMALSWDGEVMAL